MKKKLWRTWAWGISAVTAGTAVASQISLTAQAADNSQDYRRKVIGIAGIIQNVSTELEAPVTSAVCPHAGSGIRLSGLPPFCQQGVCVCRCTEGVFLCIQYSDCGRGKLDDRVLGRHV